MYDMYDMDQYEFEEEEEDTFYSYDDVGESASLSSTELQDLCRHCVLPTVTEMYSNMIKLFVACVIFRVFTMVRIPVDVPQIHHIISAAIGLFLLHTYFRLHCWHIGVLLFLGYLLLFGSDYVLKGHRGMCTGIPLLVYLVLCEFMVAPEVWQKVRGPQMVAAMKVISLAFDMDQRKVLNVSLFEYFGYTLCVGTSVFGPWVPFSEYRDVPSNKQWFLGRIVKSALLSIVFFVLSVCFLEWLVPSSSSEYWLVYRDALLFRVGHYFISYISECSATLAGFNASALVTAPLKIELPHSLVEVVVFWNMPMHKWLKNYVFKTTIRYGSFTAVMTTYGVSALLHGLNYRLAGVLFSLGIYTYVEHSLRCSLARKLDACLLSRPCQPHCAKHKYTANNLLVYSANLLFTLLAVFHLAYLGSLMDTADAQSVPLTQAFDRWHNLNYASMWVVLASYTLYLII